MSQNFHTPITAGAQANAGAVNDPLSELDAALSVSLDADGTLKAGAVDNTAALADGIVTAAKLAAAVAGNGLAGGAGSALSVSVDDSTLEISGDALRAKDGGITNAKLATDAKVGSLTALTTTIKTSIQAAINELVTSIAVNTASILTLIGGATVSNARLIEWAEAAAYELTSITYSTTYPTVISTATVKWPDASAGTFTATTINASFRAIDAYTITHTASGKTVTQSAVTRNSAGAVITKPALSVV